MDKGESDEISLEEVFGNLSAQMNGDFETISKKLSSALRKDKRETIRKEALRKYLPGFLGIGRGQIISSSSKPTEELDIMVYDASKCPVFPFANDIILFPMEGAYAVIEIESKLTKERLEHLVEKMMAIKSIPKTAYH